MRLNSFWKWNVSAVEAVGAEATDKGGAMRKTRARYLGSKVFRGYFISYMIIVFITLNLVSILGIQHITGAMKAEEIRVTESKLYTVAEDVELQLENMQAVAVEVASLKAFNWDYVKLSKINEINLLDRLEGYKSTLGICELYFIKYSESDYIYTSLGTAMPLQIYFYDRYGDDYEEAMELIEQSCIESKERLMLYKLDDTVLFMYPLKKYAESKIGVEGVLCFQVTEKELLKRVEKIVGKMPGEFFMYYKDSCIWGEDTELQIKLDGDENTLEMVSQKGNLRIYYLPEQESSFAWRHVFSKVEIIIFISIFLMMSALGFFVAFWNFKPMERIAEKYNSVMEDELAADWNSIDTLIETLLSGKERNSKLFQQQYQLFKEQTIRLIASGDYSDQVQEYTTLLGIKLDAPLYGIIKCHFTDIEEVSGQKRDICKGTEELSDDGISLYSYWDSNLDFNVLAAMEELYQMEDIVEMLYSLFETKNVSAKAEVIEVCSDLKQLNKNKDNIGQRMYMNGQVSAENMLEADCSDMEKISEKKHSIAGHAIEYIKANCTRYDISLDLIAQEFNITSTHLSRIIKQEIGISYKEYLTDLRINEAKKLLEKEEISVLDVSQRVGYSNASYFIKVFQKYTGETPAQYRDRHS